MNQDFCLTPSCQQFLSHFSCRLIAKAYGLLVTSTPHPPRWPPACPPSCLPPHGQNLQTLMKISKCQLGDPGACTPFHIRLTSQARNARFLFKVKCESRCLCSQRKPLIFCLLSVPCSEVSRLLANNFNQIKTFRNFNCIYVKISSQGVICPEGLPGITGPL